MNSIAVPILVILITNNKNFIDQKEWLKDNGLPDDVVFFAAVNAVTPLIALLDINHQIL